MQSGTVSKTLCQQYRQPVYGAPGGIPSLNFASSDGYAWIDIATDGSATDPYARLKQYAQDLLPNGVNDNASLIAEGGAATTAYARLQFADMDASARDRIESSLLRYCELETLAMVMVVQAWRGV